MKGLQWETIMDYVAHGPSLSYRITVWENGSAEAIAWGVGVRTTREFLNLQSAKAWCEEQEAEQ